jgi:hypothetical protein
MPTALATINAAEAAPKTIHLLMSLAAANSMVESWGLSPSSAITTETKTVANSTYFFTGV